MAGSNIRACKCYKVCADYWTRNEPKAPIPNQRRSRGSVSWLVGTSEGYNRIKLASYHILVYSGQRLYKVPLQSP